jgi:hypothetical protein
VLVREVVARHRADARVVEEAVTTTEAHGVQASPPTRRLKDPSMAVYTHLGAEDMAALLALWPG